MAEIYGRKDGLCGGYGGSMHLVDPERGFLGTSGIVGQGIPQATGVAFAAQIRNARPGGAVLLRRRRLQAGRVPRVAQPRVAVEAAGRLRDGEQQLQRGHALRAGGRQRRRRRAAVGQGQGLQHARRHRRRRRSGGGVRDGRARRSTAPAPATGRRWSSRRSTGCRRHGNIIAPPGVPLHYPEHEAITVFGNREEYEAALRGDPVPRFRARLVEQGVLDAGAGRRDRAAGPRRDGRGGAVRARQPVPRARSGARQDYVYA